jgi:hypothetical protein
VAKRISTDEFERTITFSFTRRANSSSNWAWTVCVKDTLSNDGLSLPGHHGCGSSRVRRTATYLASGLRPVLWPRVQAMHGGLRRKARICLPSSNLSKRAPRG